MRCAAISSYLCFPECCSPFTSSCRTSLHPTTHLFDSCFPPIFSLTMIKFIILYYLTIYPYDVLHLPIHSTLRALSLMGAYIAHVRDRGTRKDQERLVRQCLFSFFKAFFICWAFPNIPHGVFHEGFSSAAVRQGK